MDKNVVTTDSFDDTFNVDKRKEKKIVTTSETTFHVLDINHRS